MLNYLLRLYLRRGAKLAVKRLFCEMGPRFKDSDFMHFSDVAIDDFFFRVRRRLERVHYEAASLLEEETVRAKLDPYRRKLLTGEIVIEIKF